MQKSAKCRRRIAVINGLVALVTCLLLACAPAPAPTPSPTPAFASEEAAFAAAEEVYRAYNDALNALDAADPSTFEPLFETSSGEFEAADREYFSKAHAEGQQFSGDALVLSFEGLDASPRFEHLVAAVCLDVSAVKVSDADGNSLVAPTRPDVYALSVEFIVDDSNRLTIDSSSRAGDDQCAD